MFIQSTTQNSIRINKKRYSRKKKQIEKKKKYRQRVNENGFRIVQTYMNIPLTVQ